MRKLIALALAATSLVPVAANAEVSRGELRRDRGDIREEREEYRDAVRYGSRTDVREERGEYRDAQREYREDLGDYRDDFRNGNRGRHHAGYGRSHHDERWNAPFSYRRYGRGDFANRYHYAPRYEIGNPGRWGLPQTRGSFRWVRHYDDALLIDMRRGEVVRVVRHAF